MTTTQEMPGRTRPVVSDDLVKRRRKPTDARIIAAVSDTTATAVATAATRAARERDAQITFVYARRGPSAILGEPYYQRRLSRKLRRAQRALDVAVAVAARGGVVADGEVVEGRLATRILDLARVRKPGLLMLGRGTRAERRAQRRLARASAVPVVAVDAEAVRARVGSR